MKIIISAAISAAISAIVTTVWWFIMTLIAYAITKSGGTGEWVNNLKPYVLTFIFLVSFLLTWAQIALATAKQKPTLRSRYR